MRKLITPLGTLSIFFDDIEINYEAIRLGKNTKLFPNIEGRYKITVGYNSDNIRHKIHCIINNLDYSKVEQVVESGEGLECQSFYLDKIKLSIGIECDVGYFHTGERIGTYDYDSLYLENGMGYDILQDTKSQEFVFFIAWITESTDDTEVETWFAADPTMI
ncbi:hypothetical protein GOQ27_03640 [Clostridium sp. D2Q-11]|uniref:Uncharacterized protein n=1 Tax=Anaeromonas frigoriresistens TaxID=2683708 RepID=A0A942UQQ9_9FIRM|nr:hypothetical protein [Anaeromonas frigoriresistens]MBS4537539.1 hypothetical protein [Anaeromonas frigoriresistens]